MTDYVLGFLFDLKQKHVLLIKKNKPDWQKGKLNGVGGKIEIELPFDAMVREFKEETGIQYNNWREVCNMHGSDWNCRVFTGFSDLIWSYTNLTDEVLYIHHIESLPANCLPSIHWLVPMCLDKEIVDKIYKVQT